ncbi:uncharacterized protein BJ171DRAFT_9739 [Polychytrium aggregatum]|uniref:uncharacterized protein n=1 Tax=Polychytrium aggregatum TaxID=110093 RepID=UPI0022FEAD0A|nr:uncharacterized protein BJ171DRAFT_9739 [Polychytrium aggregatum]KAI9209861.1 hypothetical protein BJ171DRAFT_9739 [Polychytrium aggregatum]
MGAGSELHTRLLLGAVSVLLGSQASHDVVVQLVTTLSGSRAAPLLKSLRSEYVVRFGFKFYSDFLTSVLHQLPSLDESKISTAFQNLAELVSLDQLEPVIGALAATKEHHPAYIALGVLMRDWNLIRDFTDSSYSPLLRKSAFELSLACLPTNNDQVLWCQQARLLTPIAKFEYCKRAVEELFDVLRADDGQPEELGLLPLAKKTIARLSSLPLTTAILVDVLIQNGWVEPSGLKLSDFQSRQVFEVLCGCISGNESGAFVVAKILFGKFAHYPPTPFGRYDEVLPRLVTFPRDIHIWGTFRRNEWLWDLTELCATDKRSVPWLTEIVRPLLAYLIGFWEQDSRLAPPRYPYEMNAALVVVLALTKMEVVSGVFGQIGLLFPLIEAKQLAQLLWILWQLLKGFCNAWPDEQRRQCQTQGHRVIVDIVKRRIDECHAVALPFLSGLDCSPKVKRDTESLM